MPGPSLAAGRPGTGITPDDLGGLTEGSQKCVTHAATVHETGFPRDDLNRVMALLDQEPCGFQT